MVVTEAALAAMGQMALQGTEMMDANAASTETVQAILADTEVDPEGTSIGRTRCHPEAVLEALVEGEYLMKQTLFRTNILFEEHFFIYCLVSNVSQLV